MRPLFLAALPLVLAAAPAPAQDWQAVPPGGESLLRAGFDLANAPLGTFGGADAVAESVAAPGLPVDAALRVTNRAAIDPRYAVQVSVPTRGDVAAGDTLLMSLFARGAAADGGPLSVHARLQQNGGEYNDGGYAELVPLDVDTPGDLGDPAGWTQYFRAVKAPLAQPDGTHSVSIHLGEKAQTVELAGLQVLNYGPDRDRESLPVTRTTYPGAEPDAPWRAAAADRIERLRKADLSVTVRDAAGRPVPGAAVHVELTRHEFGFGTAVDADLLVMTRDQFERYADGGHGSYQGFAWRDVLKYREAVEANFNKVVLENDLKIGGWRAGQNDNGARFRREWTMQALQWCADRNIEVRGHYGVWGPIDAGQPWNTGGIDTGPGYGEAMLEYLREFVPQVAGKVGEWDAINHIVGWGPETLGKRYGHEYYAEVLRLMRQLDPAAELWVNEGNVISGGGQDAPYRAVIEDLVKLGQPPDGVGFMGHFRDGALAGPAEMKRTFDAYAALAPGGLKLQLTELDYDTLNRDLQADYFRDVLTLAFSHPAMDGVMQWGFWEPRHWRPDAALWQANWSLRPVGQVYRDLVLNAWRTDATAKTGPDGAATVRGFRGEYRIVVAAPDGRTAESAATLGEGGANVAVTVTAP